MSKIEPNTTQTPNLYIDKLMYLLDVAELKTLMYAVRRTMGFHKGSDRISLSQFMGGNGRVDENGELVEHGTGLSKSAQVTALRNLTSFGILIEVASSTPRLATEWALQLNEQKVDWDALLERKRTRKRKGRKQTKAARVAAKAQARQSGLFNRPGNGSSLEKTANGLLRGTQGASSTDTQKPDRKPGRKEERERDDALDIVWTLLLSTCDNDEETAVNIWKLQEAFCEHSKLPRPDIDTEHGRNELADHWWPTLKQVLKACDNDLDKAIKALCEGVAAQSEWRADSVSSPKTVQKKTMALIAAWKRGANPETQKGTGQKNGRKPKRRPVSSSTQAAANYALLRQRMFNNEQ